LSCRANKRHRILPPAREFNDKKELCDERGAGQREWQFDLGGSGKRSLPMVWASTIGKAFSLAAATRRAAKHDASLLDI
jgi:hypothetical protein